MTKEKFRKLIREYVEYDREVRNYRDRFFTHFIDGRVINKATKIFTHEELDKLERMEEKLGKIRKNWLIALSKRDF